MIENKDRISLVTLRVMRDILLERLDAMESGKYYQHLNPYGDRYKYDHAQWSRELDNILTRLEILEKQELVLDSVLIRDKMCTVKYEL